MKWNYGTLELLHKQQTFSVLSESSRVPKFQNAFFSTFFYPKKEQKLFIYQTGYHHGEGLRCG